LGSYRHYRWSSANEVETDSYKLDIGVLVKLQTSLTAVPDNPNT